MDVVARQKPNLPWLAILNMAFGFFGLQVGFALQNANASRIFLSLGAELEWLPLLLLAGPITGLIVQPIIGYFSDRTWGRFGRRRPYFFVGAICATLGLFLMPYSPVLWMAASSLWIIDASLNISMEPFRAFVGDNLNSKQRTLGYALQGFMIGGGTWLASKLPNFLTAAGISNTAEANQIPDSVKFAFLIGGVLLFICVLWTVLKSKEYSPEELAAFEASDTSEAGKARNSERVSPAAGYFMKWGGLMLSLGVLLTAFVATRAEDQQFFVFSIGLVITGLLFLYNGLKVKRGKAETGLISTVLSDLATMPLVMKRLAAVQFTSWFAFFIMWAYLNPGITSHYFGATDTTSEAYNLGSLAVNNIFANYGLASFFFSLAIPFIARGIGLKISYALYLLIGGLSLISFYFMNDPQFLWIQAMGIGVVWAAVLILPYSILADALPASKMGTYMGIFNFFIVIPQIVVGTVMGPIVKNFLGNEAILALVVGGGVMMVGALLLAFVPYKKAAIH